MKGTLNPCVTWTLHAGSYCVLSQWRPRPRWWKVYSPDEAVQPWLTPPPPNPCCHGLESKRVPLSTHFTTLWVGDRPAPFLACFSLPLLRTMSLLVDWHTCVLLPIDLFSQEKHYKTIFLINIKTSVPSTGVCPLRSAHTFRHCLYVQRNHLWYLVPNNWQCESDACPNQCCFNCPLTEGYPDIICFDGWFQWTVAFHSWGKH